jgi:hypothetical protein
MICATINKVFTITNSSDFTYIFWSYREGNLALLVANLPFCWPIFQMIFSLSAFSQSTKVTETDMGSLVPPMAKGNAKADNCHVENSP